MGDKTRSLAVKLAAIDVKPHVRIVDGKMVRIKGYKRKGSLLAPLNLGLHKDVNEKAKTQTEYPPSGRVYTHTPSIPRKDMYSSGTYFEGYMKDETGDAQKVYESDKKVTVGQVSNALKLMSIGRGGWSSSGKVKGWGHHMEGYETEVERIGPTRIYGGDVVTNKWDNKQRRVRATRTTAEPSGRIIITWSKGEKHNRRTEAEAFEEIQDALALQGIHTKRATEGTGMSQKNVVIAAPPLTPKQEAELESRRSAVASRLEDEIRKYKKEFDEKEGIFWPRRAKELAKPVAKYRGTTVKKLLASLGWADSDFEGVK